MKIIYSKEDIDLAIGLYGTFGYTENDVKKIADLTREEKTTLKFWIDDREEYINPKYQYVIDNFRY